MDIFNNNEISLHLVPIPRRFAASPMVSAIGYMPAKTIHISHRFASYNFSFILNGEGRYYYQGRYMEVKAPCVITQSPGTYVDYGPQPHWEELYLMYDADQVPDLTAKGFIRDGVPLWHIHEPGQMQVHLTDLMRMLPAPYIDPFIDKIDAVCSLLIMESILGETPVNTEGNLSAIRAIEAYTKTHLHEEIDFAVLAAKYQLHPATFRRRWMRMVGIPPQRFLMIQRVKEACRLLVETTMTIRAISTFLRFDDPLYFSRKFRQLTGMTATEYRHRFRALLSIQQLPENLPLRFTRSEQEAIGDSSKKASNHS